MNNLTFILIVGLALLLVVIVFVAFWGNDNTGTPGSYKAISGYDPPSTDPVSRFTPSQRAAALRAYYSSNYDRLGIRVMDVSVMNKIEPGVYDVTFTYTKKTRGSESNVQPMEKRVTYGTRNGTLRVLRIINVPSDELPSPSEPMVVTTTGQKGVTTPIIADRTRLLPEEYAFIPTGTSSPERWATELTPLLNMVYGRSGSSVTNVKVQRIDDNTVSASFNIVGNAGGRPIVTGASTCEARLDVINGVQSVSSILSIGGAHYNYA